MVLNYFSHNSLTAFKAVIVILFILWIATLFTNKKEH